MAPFRRQLSNFSERSVIHHAGLCFMAAEPAVVFARLMAELHGFLTEQPKPCRGEPARAMVGPSPGT